MESVRPRARDAGPSRGVEAVEQPPQQHLDARVPTLGALEALAGMRPPQTRTASDGGVQNAQADSIRPRTAGASIATTATADSAIGTAQLNLFEQALGRRGARMQPPPDSVPGAASMALTQPDAEAGQLARSPLHLLDAAAQQPASWATRVYNAPPALIARDLAVGGGIASALVSLAVATKAAFPMVSAGARLAMLLSPGGPNSPARAMAAFNTTGDLERKTRLTHRLLAFGTARTIALTIKQSGLLIRAMDAFSGDDREAAVAALSVMKRMLVHEEPGRALAGGTNGFWQALLDEFHPQRLAMEQVANPLPMRQLVGAPQPSA